mmetsp:Transcript_35115/g.72193  ORF Transcript_35115/g.72193 Transcript_35115/m.72193 type:complete len:262 (+) Transcript_35115:846-1631(+)
MLPDDGILGGDMRVDLLAQVCQHNSRIQDGSNDADRCLVDEGCNHGVVEGEKKPHETQEVQGLPPIVAHEEGGHRAQEHQDQPCQAKNSKQPVEDNIRAETVKNENTVETRNENREDAEHVVNLPGSFSGHSEEIVEAKLVEGKQQGDQHRHGSGISSAVQAEHVVRGCSNTQHDNRASAGCGDVGHRPVPKPRREPGLHCQLALGQEEAKNADKEEQCEASVDEDVHDLLGLHCEQRKHGSQQLFKPRALRKPCSELSTT